MRIVIDMQACQNGSRQRGIGRYAMAIAQAMIAADRGHDIRLLLSDGFPATIAPIRRAFEGVLAQERILVCAMPGRTASANPANAWRTRAAEIMRGRFIASLAPDWLFVPSLFEGFHDAVVTSVEPGAYSTAVTLFDFIPLEYPEQYLPGAPIRAAYQRKLRDAGNADLLLPISHYVAREAAARLGVPEERIVPVPLGVEAMFRPPPAGSIDRAGLMRRHGIARPFVLNASPFEYRKNMPGLIAGFAAVPRALREAHQLVIVGRMDEAARRAIAALAAKAGLREDAVVLAGFVSDEDLLALYSEAALFAFPSLSEGFGLPVIEAMACGAPVIGSATTSIPEVIGRADLLCDPADPRSIGAAMARVLGDPALQAELRAWGFERSRGFTWAGAAAATLDALERGHARRAPAAPAPASPASARPSLCLVAPTVAAVDAQGAYIRALVPALADHFAVTLACPEGGFGDERMAALFEARDLGWFERNAPRFDHLVYACDGVGAGRIERLAAVYPGTLLRPADAAGPIGGSIFIGTVVAGGVPDADAASLREALPRFAAAAPPDRAREIAALLPERVRDVAPTSDDLARLARAIARNETQDRAPHILVDLSGLESAEAARPHRRLLRTLVALNDEPHSGVHVGGIRLAKGRFVRADAWLDPEFNAGILDGEPLPLRAGDRIIGFDRLGAFGVPAALQEASAAGAGLLYVATNRAQDERIVLQALAGTRATPVSTLSRDEDVVQAAELPSRVTELRDAGIPVDFTNVRRLARPEDSEMDGGA